MWNPFKIIDKAVDRVGYWYGAYVILAGSSVMGFVAGWVASYSSWVAQFGAIGWLISGLVSALLFAVIAAVSAIARHQWVKAAALNKWKKDVDQINPLESEFSKKRIKILDIADPITQTIFQKHFIGCDLIGPANIVIQGGSITHSGFINCDVIPMRDGVQLANAIALRECIVSRCRIANVTIYADQQGVDAFRQLGRVEFAAYTKDELLSPPPPSGIGEEKLP